MTIKRIAISMLALALLICAGCAEAPPAAPTQAEETQPEGRHSLSVTFDFKRQSGSASNQFAVWIEDLNGGKLVKTLCATEYTAEGGWEVRPDSLATWVRKAMGVSDFDAVAAATPKSGRVSYTWDFMAEDGMHVPPGVYRFVVEGTLRWKNYVLFTGLIDSEPSVQGEPEFFFAGDGRYPALDENAPECGMITNVQAVYSGN